MARNYRALATLKGWLFAVHTRGLSGPRRPQAREFAGRGLHRILATYETNYDADGESVEIVVPPVLLDVVAVGAVVTEPFSVVAHGKRA
jgi:hypothetical protein